MLNYEASNAIDLTVFSNLAHNNLITLDFEIADGAIDAVELIPFTSSLQKLENLILYFNGCSDIISNLLKCVAPEMASIRHLAILFKNINYNQHLYSTINNFFLCLKRLNYLNFMIYHDLRLKYNNSYNIDIVQLCRTLPTLKDLSSLKLSLNPPWEAEALCLSPIFSQLPLLENLEVLLWLKTESKIMFSLPKPVANRLKSFTLSISTKMDESFINSLIDYLGELRELASLNLGLAYTNKVSFNEFKNLLMTMKSLSKLEYAKLRLNVNNEDRDFKVNQLQRAIKDARTNPIDEIIKQMNQELTNEKKDLSREISAVFEDVKSLKKIVFMHAAKQFFAVNIR